MIRSATTPAGSELAVASRWLGRGGKVPPIACTSTPDTAARTGIVIAPGSATARHTPIRWLDVNLDDLFARPTDADLADIDSNGVLRAAAETLQAKAAEESVEGKRAAAALERLYVEQKRSERLERG